jgi:SAM-dependent methyltransferase
VSAQTAFWDRVAGRYAARKIGDPDAYAETLDRTRAHLAATDRVAEVGCGTGLTAVALAPSVAAYHATDLSPAMIAIAQARPETTRIPHLRFDIAAHDAGARDLDAILAFSLLHLLGAEEDGAIDRGLSALRDRLRQGGILVSKTPCLAALPVHIRLLVRLLQAAGQLPRFAFLHGDALEARIAAAGFEIVETADLPAARGARFVVARRR